MNFICAVHRKRFIKGSTLLLVIALLGLWSWSSLAGGPPAENRSSGPKDELAAVINRLYNLRPFPAVVDQTWVLSGESSYYENWPPDELERYLQATENELREGPREPGYVHLQLGDMLYTKKAFPSATVHYLKALDHDPDAPTPRIRLGNSYLRAGEVERAAATYSYARNQDSSGVYPEIRNNLAVALILKGDLTSALAMFVEMMNLSKSLPAPFHHYQNAGTAYLMTGDLGRGDTLLEKAAAMNPGSIVALNNAAVVHMAKGNLEQADQDLADAMSLNGSYLPGLFNRGGLDARLGRFDEAQSAFRQVLAQSPEFPDISRELGMLLVRTGSAEEGRIHLENAFARKPVNRYTRLFLALACEATEKLDQALAHYSELLEADAKDPDARTGLSRVRSRLKRG
ncbi:MAG: tetratricopeptide repeat protein [Firmicutes bacterium]|nr:tetratricopeptide repeat protein [Bacillota bacterium]